MLACSPLIEITRVRLARGTSVPCGTVYHWRGLQRAAPAWTLAPAGARGGGGCRRRHRHAVINVAIVPPLIDDVNLTVASECSVNIGAIPGASHYQSGSGLVTSVTVPEPSSRLARRRAHIILHFIVVQKFTIPSFKRHPNCKSMNQLAIF